MLENEASAQIRASGLCTVPLGAPFILFVQFSGVYLCAYLNYTGVPPPLAFSWNIDFDQRYEQNGEGDLLSGPAAVVERADWSWLGNPAFTQYFVFLCLGGIFWKRSAGQKQAEQTSRSGDGLAGRGPKPSGEEIFCLHIPRPFLRPSAQRLHSCPPHQTCCRTYVYQLAAGSPG